MAIVVIGGLILSTMLTLVVIPVMYTYFDDFTIRVQRSWGQLFPRKPLAPGEEPDDLVGVGTDVMEPD
jgi:hypothetical protein